METKVLICETGREKYPFWLIALGNLLMLIWVTLGTVACYFLNAVVAWVYLGVTLFLVYIALRKLVCTNCYYYGKWCSTGWGKLSALLFKQGDIEKFNDSIGVKLAPAIYGLLTLIPLVLGTVSAIIDFSPMKPVVLAGLLLMGFISGSLTRKSTCSECRMREYCRGSAAKVISEPSA